MHRRHPHFTFLLVGLLILLTTGQGLASGFVLCIGADGHSAFEEAAAGRCTPAPVAPAVPADEGYACSAADDHCGPCHDIAASGDSLQTRARIDDDAPIAAPVMSPPVIQTIPGFVRELTVNLSPQPPPRPADILASLRTTVLRN